jgi:hypothetical protein
MNLTYLLVARWMLKRKLDILAASSEFSCWECCHHIFGCRRRTIRLIGVRLLGSRHLLRVCMLELGGSCQRNRKCSWLWGCSIITVGLRGGGSTNRNRSLSCASWRRYSSTWLCGRVSKGLRNRSRCRRMKARRGGQSLRSNACCLGRIYGTLRI